MSPNDILKNALEILTMYKGFVPADQYTKKVYPVVDQIRDYLATQTLTNFKSYPAKNTGQVSTGFGLFNDALKENHRNNEI